MEEGDSRSRDSRGWVVGILVRAAMLGTSEGTISSAVHENSTFLEAFRAELTWLYVAVLWPLFKEKW